MSSIWHHYGIAFISALATLALVVLFGRARRTASWPLALRWMVASVVATGLILLCAYADLKRRHWSADANLIAVGQCAVVVTVAALLARFNGRRRPRSAADRERA